MLEHHDRRVLFAFGFLQAQIQIGFDEFLGPFLTRIERLAKLLKSLLDRFDHFFVDAVGLFREAVVFIDDSLNLDLLGLHLLEIRIELRPLVQLRSERQLQLIAEHRIAGFIFEPLRFFGGALLGGLPNRPERGFGDFGGNGHVNSSAAPAGHRQLRYTNQCIPSNSVSMAMLPKWPRRWKGFPPRPSG